MKVDVFSMEDFAANLDGRLILTTAHANHAWHIIQRLAPKSGDNPNGEYLVMLLNWPDNQITRMIFNGEEVNNFATYVKMLSDMSVFDAFDEEGVEPV